jgi:diguanylate cyclase (GGDEF)-like protein
LGTLCCIAVAFLYDSYSFSDGSWRWGGKPLNNVVIPLLLAPPFFLFLLGKLRELAIANERLMQIASTDGLTSCLSRVAFTTLVDAYLQKFAAADDPNHEGALLVLDVDHFKSVNDRFGHDVGDEALKMIVGSIRGTVRDVDLVGRMGGEEFGVFLPGISPDDTATVAARILRTVAATNFSPGGIACPLSVSIGGTTFAGPQAADFAALYKVADRRLYDAKRNGRNRVELATLELAGMHQPREMRVH